MRQTKGKTESNTCRDRKTDKKRYTEKTDRRTDSQKAKTSRGRNKQTLDIDRQKERQLERQTDKETKKDRKREVVRNKEK